MTMNSSEHYKKKKNFFATKKFMFGLGICLGAGIVIGAYWAGGRVATQKCDARIANMNARAITCAAKTMEKVNVETVNTSLYDIRRILRERYSIAE